jgi:hypothetical protein
MRLEKLQFTEKFFGAWNPEQKSEVVRAARGFGGGFG